MYNFNFHPYVVLGPWIAKAKIHLEMYNGIVLETV